MVQVQILSGIYAGPEPEVRQSYPVNMVPVPETSGVSSGFLRPGDGMIEAVDLSVTCRGLFAWNNILYGVFGTTLYSFDSNFTPLSLGAVADGGPVSWAQGFDRLGIASGGFLYYWDGSSLITVTDPDVGTVIDVIWIDGYWMVTDGEFLAVSDLTDPTSFNPLKYGSSEASPDPVTGLQRLRNEAYALNRFTIEVFDNVGGTGFPFQRIEGAQIQKGCLGTHASCIFNGEAVAFVGGGQGEAPGIYLGGNGQVRKISTNTVDRILADYTEVQLADTVCEYRNDDGSARLYVHLPTQTLVFDAAASQEFGTSVWYILTSTTDLDVPATYRARFFTWVFDRWVIADPTSTTLGYITREVSTQWGDKVSWRFATPIVYNDSKSVVVKSLELVALTGSTALGAAPRISTQYSRDGVTWSQPMYINVGELGQRQKRLAWFRQGAFRSRRIQRFDGDSGAHIAFVRLEADLDGGQW